MKINLEPLLSYGLTLFPLTLGLICLYYALRFLQNIRKLETTPTSKIRSAAQGYVELSGYGKPLPTTPVYSRIHQQPCLWYQTTIEERQTFQNGEVARNSFKVIRQDRSQSCFILRDNTGECLVDPAGADIYTMRHIVAYGSTQNPHTLRPPTVWSWLLGTHARYRYRESLILENDFLTVNGNFDTPHQTNPYIQKAQGIPRSLLTNRGLSDDHTFVISAITHAQLIRRLRIQAVIFFIAFLFFSILTVHSHYPFIQQCLPQMTPKLFRLEFFI